MLYFFTEQKNKRYFADASQPPFTAVFFTILKEIIIDYQYISISKSTLGGEFENGGFTFFWGGTKDEGRKDKNYEPERLLHI